MKQVLWITLFLLGAIGVVMPLFYLYTASRLPALESDLDLHRLLKDNIESERMGMKRTQYDPRGMKVDFERPDFSRLPKDLVGLYISQRGCPGYFQTEREDGATWGWRMAQGLIGRETGGDGWCERVFSMRLAERIGIKGNLEVTVAAHKIHGFLNKDQLIAYDLFSHWFEPGVIGVDEVAKKLFKKELEDLQLSELSELMLTLPPLNFYGEMRDCQNPTLIRQARDNVIEALARHALVAPDRAKNAQQQPVACTVID